MIPSAFLSFPLANSTRSSLYLQDNWRTSAPYLSAARSLNLTPCRFDRGDVSFIIVAGAMVAFMVPGLGACCLSWRTRLHHSQTALQLFYIPAYLVERVHVRPPLPDPVPVVSEVLLSFADLGCRSQQCCCHLPVVFLGILARVLALSHQRIHRES